MRAISSVLTALVVVACASSMASRAQDSGRQGFASRFAERRAAMRDSTQQDSSEEISLGGVDSIIWAPPNISTPLPLIVFSHGFHGTAAQSKFLMRALANAGYIVVAPNHADATGRASLTDPPQVGFAKINQWTSDTYRDRHDDVVNLIDGLHKDARLNAEIDWTKIGLAGHSLGGYTALGLAGAWKDWKIPGVKAVLALSPYAQPYLVNGTLNLGVPVMYQGGTRDWGITPFVKAENGAFAKTSSPAYFIEFDNATHLAFSDLNRDPESKNLICHYAIDFFNRYVKGDTTIKIDKQLPGVSEFEVK